MNTYVISGAEKTTGVDMRIELEAASEDEARQAALKEGILITECKQLKADAPPVKAGDAYLREIAMWVRFFGITTALALFAVAVKVIMSH